MGGVGERKLLNDTDLSLAFAERKNEKKMVLLVGFVDKPTEIDWDSLEITPLTADQIGVLVPVMDEDTMYEFLGLRVEDERAGKARTVAIEKGNQIDLEPTDELLVDDHVPGEDSVFYDRENPPMEEGTIYASMSEFRAAVRQHAIIKQFEFGTKRSCTTLFRGYCKGDGCSWAIVGRLMRDNQQVRVTLNKEKHFCPSTGRVRTKLATYHWVAEKAIRFLKKDPNMGTKKLQTELQDKYQVTIGYGTVHLGKDKAIEQIFGTWEESFGYLFNFKAEIELRMSGSVVEIDVINKEDGVYFHRFFCCLKPSIDGFLNGCRPFFM